MIKLCPPYPVINCLHVHIINDSENVFSFHIEKICDSQSDINCLKGRSCRELPRYSIITDDASSSREVKELGYEWISYLYLNKHVMFLPKLYLGYLTESCHRWLGGFTSLHLIGRRLHFFWRESFSLPSF